MPQIKLDMQTIQASTGKSWLDQDRETKQEIRDRITKKNREKYLAEQKSKKE